MFSRVYGRAEMNLGSYRASLGVVLGMIMMRVIFFLKQFVSRGGFCNFSVEIGAKSK
jgi:hypothetical protein